MRSSILFSSVLAAMILASATAALGQGAGAIVTQFNTDARTEGMGRTGTAVWWDDTPSAWANPGLLGYQRGLGYRDFHSKLAVGLADDIFIDANELTLGFAGVGLVYGHDPFETYLDLGEQVATDENGNVVDSFESWERLRHWGLGLSLGRLLEAVVAPDAAVRRLTRRLDVAGGIVWKDFEDRLVDDGVLQDGHGGSASASTRDHGLLVRARLYDSLSGPDWLPALDRALEPVISGWTLDVAYGRSWINWTEDRIVHIDASQADPFQRENRSAWSLRWAAGLPGGFVESGPGWLVDTLSPLVSFGYAWRDSWPGYRWDPDAGDYVFEDDDDPRVREEGDGWELTVLGIYSLRGGHVRAPYGDVDGDTEGWGLGLNLAGAIKLRYDEATRPQARGLPSVDLRTWTVVVDGFKLAALARHR
jgi:hypothetical protein